MAARRHLRRRPLNNSEELQSMRAESRPTRTMSPKGGRKRGPGAAEGRLARFPTNALVGSRGPRCARPPRLLSLFPSATVTQAFPIFHAFFTFGVCRSATLRKVVRSECTRSALGTEDYGAAQAVFPSPSCRGSHDVRPRPHCCRRPWSPREVGFAGLLHCRVINFPFVVKNILRKILGCYGNLKGN